MDLLERVQASTGLAVEQGVPGAALTTFRIGGPLQYLVEPQTVEQLTALLRILSEAGQKVRVIGAGSNLLISSAGLNGWFVRLAGGFKSYTEIEDGLFRAGAGCSLVRLSKEISERGFAGMEFSTGIPGSVGGAVRMNAGAFGGQLAEVVVDVGCMDGRGVFRRLEKKDLKHGYRSMGLPEGLIICDATLRVAASEKEQIESKVNTYRNERMSKQPKGHPCAGSIFKNPSPDRPAGRLIDQCGFKGKRIGGALISPLHANWIVNETNAASHSDVLALMDLCRRSVLDKFGVSLSSELCIWAF